MKMSAAAKYLRIIFVGKKHSIFCVFIVLMSITTLWSFYRYLFVTDRYVLAIDSLCSDTIHNEIKYYAQKNLLRTTFNAHSIQTLKSTFNFLDKIDARYVRPGQLHLSLRTLIPIICINKDQVMLENGLIVSKNIFRHDIIAELATIHVAEQEMVTSSTTMGNLRNWLELCNLDLLALYQVQWINPTRIQLVDKATPYFSIITDHSKMPTTSCFAQCNFIKNQLFEHNKVRQNKTEKKYNVDVRFKNQFIVHTVHEGVA